MKIAITSQDGLHQYDEYGRAITTWNKKKCAWIVNPEFENSNIDWYGKDSDFAGGCTEKEFIKNNPNWDKCPDINVTWFYNSLKTLVQGFGEELWWREHRKFDEKDNLLNPEVVTRDWGWMDSVPKEDVVKFFGNHFKCADRVIVKYNDEVLFDGKSSEIK